MRSVIDRHDPDRTARARIRDAAITCVVRSGFDVSLRAIARDANVSGGLIVHHYGSKEGLLQACDEYVTQQIADLRDERMEMDGASEQLLQALAMPEYSWLLGYLVRSMQHGGSRAAAMYERFLSDARRQMAKAERLGLVVPSRDPEARVRWMTSTTVGSLLVLAAIRPPDDGDFVSVIRDWIDEFTLPALELHTEAMFVDRTYLDLYLEAYPQPADSSADTPTQENS